MRGDDRVLSGNSAQTVGRKIATRVRFTPHDKMIAPALTSKDQASEIRTFPVRISDVVKPWAELSPDHPALVEASGIWTYRQLASAISGTQAWLRKSAVRPGD